ncbi:O-Antigen ligase [Rosistilla oblonga]|uniref:O-antigen ligase family protein n=1 Tax=Rosistilla oblonga TaxID=2527990 RepID=UPI00118C299E|nr:O-antigen ligase family protein [Rosistilla oblonga]QDV11305.1 O-Antigen ligase [Rosistilla oblonga]
MDDSPSTIERLAGKAFDWALYGVLFVAPLFMGGRGPLGKFVFVCFVSLMTLAWIVQSLCRKAFVLRLSGAEWIIAAGALLLVFQLIPWPESVLLTFSPKLRELLPIWFSSPDPNHFQIGTWNTISLAPNATRQALAVYLAYSLFFMLLVQRIRKLKDVEWLLRSLAYGTIGLAALGLAQFLASNGKFLWLYEHPFRTTDGVVTGPFQNKNHFAHMMALGIGPLLWLLSIAIRGDATPTHSFKSKRNSRRQFSGMKETQGVSIEVLAITFGIGLVTLAAMLTFSRGGFLVFATATLVAVGLYRWQGLGQGTMFKIAAGIGTMVVVALCIYGYEPLARRLSTLHESQSLEELSHGRRALWDAMLSATQNFWLTGTGIGSHPDVYPVYMAEFYNVDFTHGESGYLQLLMEGGVGAIALLGCVMGFLSCRLLTCLRRVESSAPQHTIQLAALIAPLCAGIAVSLMHSIGDFVWYISACMSWTLIVMAAAVRLSELSRSSRESGATGSDLTGAGRSFFGLFRRYGQVTIPGPGHIVVSVICMAMIGFSITTMLPSAHAATAWNRFRVVTRDTAAGDEERKGREVALLKKTLGLDPAHRQAGVLLAQASWRAESDPASKVMASAPTKNISVLPPETLQLAVTALTHNPLLGTAYVFAVPSDFLANSTVASDALFEQALRVRKHDALIHMLRGKRQISMGRLDDGFRHWQFAFNHDPGIQASLIEQLRPIFPVSFLLEKLQPETPGLWRMYYAYREASDLSATQILAKQLVHRLATKQTQQKDPAKRAELCYSLHALYRQLGEERQVVDALQKALECQPSNYSYRKALALAFYQQDHFEQAVEHLKWCQARRSDDSSVSHALETCLIRQLENNSEHARR